MLTQKDETPKWVRRSESVAMVCKTIALTGLAGSNPATHTTKMDE